MAIQAKINPLIPAKQSSPPDIGAISSTLRALNQPWATELAIAMERLQDHCTKLQAAVRTAPEITELKATDSATGAVIATFGSIIVGVSSILNYFSKITIADHPDPTAATNTTALTPTSFKMTGLPAANPGAGTKMFYYDPADGNRVKFAP